MSKKGLCVGLLFNFIFLQGFSQVDDAGLWTSLNINKKIKKGFSLGFSQEFRFNENISELATAFSEINIDHKIYKKISGGIGYRFIQRRQLDDAYSLRHRVMIDIAWKPKIKKLNINLRERIQGQVQDVQSGPEGFDPEYYLRSKLTLKYDLDKKYEPWIAGELFYPLNNQERKVVDNMRLSAGFDYKINKHHSLDLFYLINKELNVNDPLTEYVSGVSYTYSF